MILGPGTVDVTYIHSWTLSSSSHAGKPSDPKHPLGPEQPELTDAKANKCIYVLP